MAYSDIENRYLNALASLQFPDVPEGTVEVGPLTPDPERYSGNVTTDATLATSPQGVMLADAGTKVGRAGVPFKGPTMSDVTTPLTALADTGAGIARGAVAQTLGIGGDLESLFNGLRAVFNRPEDQSRLDAFISGMEANTVLPTTEDISKKLPPVVPANAPDAQARQHNAEVGQAFGQIAPLPTAVDAGVAGLKAGAKALGPTAANMIEDSLRKAGMIMDVAPSGPSQVVIPVKVGEREVKIPAQQAATLQRALKNLTPEEQAKFRADTATKFVTILKQLPSKEEFGAAAVAGKAKKGWYEGSTQAIIQVFGQDAPRFAALLSATSPQTSVESNLFNALQVWKNWTAAGRPVDRESIVRVMGQSVQGNKGEESVLDAWINNSVRALSAEDPSTVVLSGPKVNSFMLNLQGNVNEVTNDAWMAAFTYVDQNLFSGSLTKGGDPGKGPGYIAMNARVRETAAYLTKLTGETWTPAEVQETIWSWAKTLYETAGAKGEKRSAVELIRDNAITDELIAATPDFRTLFYDERFAPILEQAGYSDQLSQLRAATAGSDVAAGAKKPGSGGQAGTLDPDSQRKYLERNAKRLDKLRADREKEAAAKAKAKVQNATGGVE